METVGSPFSTFAAVTREHCARSATSASGRLRRSLAIRICSPTVRSFAEILLGNKTDLVALVINKLDTFVVCDLFIIHCYIHDTSACSSRSRTKRLPGISFEETPLVPRREGGFVGFSLPCLGVSDKSRRRPKDSRRIASRRGAICRDDASVPNETAAARRRGLNDGRRLGRRLRPRASFPS